MANPPQSPLPQLVWNIPPQWPVYAPADWPQIAASYFSLKNLPALLPLRHERAEAQGVALWGLLLDQLDHPLQGNKSFKLSQYFLQHSLSPGQVLAIGGLRSNLVRAAATACHQLRIPFTAVLPATAQAGAAPGQYPLLDMLAGMRHEALFLSREELKAIRESEPEALYRLQERGGSDAIIIPEGAADFRGVKGVMQLGHLLKPVLAEVGAEDILCATATATALTGLSLALAGSTIQTTGIVVLKGEDRLTPQVRAWQRQYAQEAGGLAPGPWGLTWGYDFGGYGKANAALRAFQQDCARRWGFEPDLIYDAKMLWALLDLIEQGYYGRGSRVVVLLG